MTQASSNSEDPFGKKQKSKPSDPQSIKEQAKSRISEMQKQKEESQNRTIGRLRKSSEIQIK